MGLDWEKINRAVDIAYDDVLENCFGLSTAALWPFFKDLKDESEESFEAAFLMLFKRYLDDNVIVVYPPVEFEKAT